MLSVLYPTSGVSKTTLWRRRKKAQKEIAKWRAADNLPPVPAETFWQASTCRTCGTLLVEGHSQYFGRVYTVSPLVRQTMKSGWRQNKETEKCNCFWSPIVVYRWRWRSADLSPFINTFFKKMGNLKDNNRQWHFLLPVWGIFLLEKHFYTWHAWGL